MTNDPAPIAAPPSAANPALSVDPRAANTAGMAALQAGDFHIAILHFTAATSADPRAPALWRNLASAHRAAGDSAGEHAALDAALAIDQRDFAAWLRKAQLHQRMGDDAAGMAAWSGVLQLAAQFDPPPHGALADEIADGARYVRGLQTRLNAGVDADLAGPFAAMDGGDRRRAEAFVAHATGRRAIYHNQCAGLYYPFLPADEFFDAAHFPWFAALEAQTAAIQAELLALLADPGDALRPYVRLDEGTPDNVWSGLDHSLDWGACFLWEYGRPNQPVLDRCPVTAAALAAVPQAMIPDRAPSAFFSLLKPRTRIPPHTGVSNTRAIIHLPLIVPPGCGFRVGGETRNWVEGQAFAFDDTIEHEAWNDSDALRAVLILDVWNPHLSAAEQALICAYYAAADASGLRPDQGV